MELLCFTTIPTVILMDYPTWATLEWPEFKRILLVSQLCHIKHTQLDSVTILMAILAFEL